MKLYVQGKGPVTLTDRDFVAEGGEGRIYAQGDLAYKLYADPAKALPAAKLQELACLDRPGIVRPLDLVLDRRNRPVGFSMTRVRNAIPLARLFTNHFRGRHGITPERTLTLVEAIRDTIRFVHERDCLIVDGNEMNYLVGEGSFTEPYLIDVDSWQTPGFPATALNPAVRDWHSREFTPSSDWFSFAVLVCQLFVGIHPYRGSCSGFKKNDLEGRMKANVSIFNRAVSLPPTVRDFAEIPAPWLDWLIAVCEQGERLAPPWMPVAAGPVVRLKVMASTGEFQVMLLCEYGADIVRVTVWNGSRAVHTRQGIHLGKAVFPDAGAEVVFSPRSQRPLLARIVDGYLILEQNDGRRIAGKLRADRLMVVNNGLYVLHREDFIEVKIHELGERLLVAPGQVWNVLPNATTVLQNLLYQDVLGRAHLLIPIRPGSCQILPVPELDDYKIVDGRWDNGVAVIIGHREGRYDRLTLVFNQAHTRYRIRKEENVDTPTINFVTLDNGISVHLHHKLEIFTNDPEATTVRVLDNPPDVNATLARDGTAVLCFNGGRLYRIALLS